MHDSHDATATQTQPFRLRGRVQPFLTLEIASLDQPGLQAALAARLAAGAGFFRHAPLLLDLTALPAAEAPLIQGLVAGLRALSLVPAAFRARWPEVERAALAAGLGRMLEVEPRQDLAPPARRRPPVIVADPVRSGQRIYAAEADLIVLHSVSPGAQLLADGCIHVYGALRGSASAGLADDGDARIFAKIMDAERLSIAGLWLGAEDFPPEWVGRPAQLRLSEGWLRFGPLP
jgi:septum site-determining protein MinC